MPQSRDFDRVRFHSGTIEPNGQGKTLDSGHLAQFLFRRYCGVPFPAYRYLPGRDPHPIADPRGHSFLPPGTPHPRAPWHAPEDWRASEAYLFGCDLYNHAYWWEAHEAWEGLWQVCDKAAAQGRFLQGLIQVAACHLKLLGGQRDGVDRLRVSSLRYLRQVTGGNPRPVYMGLDLPAFITAVEYYWAARVPADGPLLPHDASAYPYIQLADSGSA